MGFGQIPDFIGFFILMASLMFIFIQLPYELDLEDRKRLTPKQAGYSPPLLGGNSTMGTQGRGGLSQEGLGVAWNAFVKFQFIMFKSAFNVKTKVTS